MRYALVVEYDGTRYHGFQSQTNADTIQDQIERALKKFTGEQIRIKGAGRTDTGVHAKGQVAAFSIDRNLSLTTLARAMNFHLPEDIVVKKGYKVDEEFDPRRQAVSREYRYSILNRPSPSPLMGRFSYHVVHSLRIGAMQRAAEYLEGNRSFAPFSRQLKNMDNYTRTIYNARVSRHDEMVHFDVEGNAFLPQQVRRMAGALWQVGVDNMAVDDFKSLTECQTIGAAQVTLPAQGLCLMNVNYNNFPPKAEN